MIWMGELQCLMHAEPGLDQLLLLARQAFLGVYVFDACFVTFCSYFRMRSSKSALNRMAYDGAIFVPIAVPCTCWKYCPSNSNTLFCRMIFVRWHKTSVLGVWKGRVESAFVSDVIPFSCGIEV